MHAPKATSEASLKPCKVIKMVFCGNTGLEMFIELMLEQLVTISCHSEAIFVDIGSSHPISHFLNF